MEPQKDAKDLPRASGYWGPTRPQRGFQTGYRPEAPERF
jgi:hypothetical protein